MGDILNGYETSVKKSEGKGPIERIPVLIISRQDKRL
jgi:hypothetical protein